jgi:hypothetical protein
MTSAAITAAMAAVRTSPPLRFTERFDFSGERKILRDERGPLRHIFAFLHFC